MSGRRASILLLGLALILAACQTAATDAPPIPTANAVSIQITPALRWMAPLLNDCARRTGQGIVLDERPGEALAPEQAALTLRWGAPEALPAFAVQIATDRLALVAHPSNPLSSLTREQLTGLYTGSGATWESLLPEGSGGPEGEIHHWGYASGEDIQALVDTLVLEQPERAQAVYLAPDPLAVRQSVAADAAALGFLPARYLDASLKEIQIDTLDANALTQPVLALAASEPQGMLRQFLGCVQESLP
jgi:phosphate transport system substrate-binding protein